MGVEITDTLVDDVVSGVFNFSGGGNSVTFGDELRANVREILEQGIDATPSSVGVTSSDERQCEHDAFCLYGRGHIGQCGSNRDAVRPVPSSDEPEGDDAYGNRFATWEKYRELHEAYENVSRREKRWLDHLAAIRERLGVRPDSRTLKHILRAIDRLAPAPVGDAEPVAWRVLRDGEQINIWTTEAAAREEVEMLAATQSVTHRWEVRPLYEVPVSSQDAGARAYLGTPEARIEAYREAMEQYKESRDSWRRVAERLEREKCDAVDLVLPAEGPRRGEIVRRAVDLMHGWCTEMDREVVRKLYDALRAAAGKAGSDDAR